VKGTPFCSSLEEEGRGARGEGEESTLGDGSEFFFFRSSTLPDYGFLY
jgi:hypothetical protein